MLGLLQGLLPVLSPVLPAAFSILPTAIRENIEQYNLDPAAPFYGSLLPAGWSPSSFSYPNWPLPTSSLASWHTRLLCDSPHTLCVSLLRASFLFSVWPTFAPTPGPLHLLFPVPWMLCFLQSWPCCLPLSIHVSALLSSPTCFLHVDPTVALCHITLCFLHIPYYLLTLGCSESDLYIKGNRTFFSRLYSGYIYPASSGHPWVFAPIAMENLISNPENPWQIIRSKI